MNILSSRVKPPPSRPQDQIVVVELSPHVPYSAAMTQKSLLQHNPHLRNAQNYQRTLRASVLSSIAVEGVKKAAERALNNPTRKVAKHG